ncbi:hypothetical protein KAU04_00320, partial [bacterium]|nr:hypothetical protein [bacterium]
FAYIVPTLQMAEEVVELIRRAGENRAKIVGEVGRNEKPDLRTTIRRPYEGEPLDFVGYGN